MPELKNCTTCGRKTKVFALFPCPACGEEIIRCFHCREISNVYVCPKCGLKGP
ncbi:MAG: zinc finger domain-containing protein [Candidatus Micrarchaeia archaeon]